MSGNYKMNNDSFIAKSIKVHGYEYDYSEVDYKNTSTKVIIKCKKHGPFEQTPNCHLRGRRCPKCYGNIKYTKDTFIQKCEEIYGSNVYDKYDFSLVEYRDNKTKVKIICKKHNGVFEQRPDMFLQKHGCDFCGGTFKSSTKDFVEKSNIKHNFEYDYSHVIYKNAHTKVEIGCQKHGWFSQKAHSHLRGDGCPFCNSSKGEIKIKKFLDKYNIIFEPQKKFNGCKFKNTLPFDFYLPEHKTCIEFDGVQHYKIVEHFGGNQSFKLNKIKDNIKNKFCKENGINLIRISYEEIDEIEDILKMTFLV
jgi:hypothetical protein